MQGISCRLFTLGLFLLTLSGGAWGEVEVGNAAPDFCLPSSHGEKGEQVCLRDFKGKEPVVLLFYVLDFTPG